MDTIAMHAAGFENAVATLGTAITSDHARLLARYTKRVVINYDSDEAGQKAADKAMRMLDEVGLEVRVLKLTGAKDADEYIRLYGADAFRSLLADSHTAFDFKMENVLAHHDVATAEGKIRAARELAAIIAVTASGVERELYISAAAKRLSLSTEGLADDVKRIRAKQRREAQQKEKRDVLLSARNFGDRVNPDAAKNPAAAAAEEAVLGLMMLYPEHRAAVLKGSVELRDEHFLTSLGKKAFRAILDLEKGADGYSFSALGESLTPDEMGRMVRIEQARRALSNNTQEVLEAAARVLREERQKQTDREGGHWQNALERRRAALQKKNNQKE